MSTITLQIGNSDNKLTQLEWSTFIDQIETLIKLFRGRMHFAGGSSPEKSWQNYCWVFELEDDPLIRQSVINQLTGLRRTFKQDSVAWTEGNTNLI